MSDNLYDVDPYAQKEDEQTTKSKVIGYAMIALGVLVGIFVLFRLMMRLNYKINAVRSEFRPTLKIFFIVVIVFVLLVTIIIFLLNILGKKGAYDKNYTKEKPLKE